MTPEQRAEIIRRLQDGTELSPEWARILFPPEKREYELVYHGKEREEDILANTLAVPLQAVRTFGKNGGNDWHNMLIFGDNPLGWRFFSVILGAISIVLFYLICRNLSMRWPL